MRPILILLLFSCFIHSCNTKETESKRIARTEVNLTLEKLDSIQIEYIGIPTVHDLDPVNRNLIFTDDGPYSREIVIADFDGNIIKSFSKHGDMPDAHGNLLSCLKIMDNNTFMSFGSNGFITYNFDGILQSRVILENYQVPSFQKIAMGVELGQIEDMYLVGDKGSRDIDYDKIHIHPDIKHFNLYDPLTAKNEPIISFPASTLYRSGKYFHRYAWFPIYTILDDRIHVLFGAEPVIYSFSSIPPYELLASIPIELPDYQYFQGENDLNLTSDFIGTFITTGRIENIKNYKGYFLIAYFTGYDKEDIEYSLSNKTEDEALIFHEKTERKYPNRIAVFDSLGNRMNDYVPEGMEASSMLIRDGELWMMERTDPEVENDYFKLYRVDLKMVD